MYSREEKIRAVELLIRYDLSPASVIRELGYPRRATLYAWHEEYLANGCDIPSVNNHRRYTEEQRRAAVDHFFEHGRCLARTMRALGYPSQELLASWVDELKPGRRPKRTDTVHIPEETKERAVIDVSDKPRVSICRELLCHIQLWSQGVAAMGRRWDLARLESVHLGGDGEPWCSALGAWLPRAEVVFRLDPFHVNRAILAALPDKRLAGRLIGLMGDGGKEAAVALLRGCVDIGLARPRPGAAAGYLEGNLASVAVAGPSLGTMESDNQHLYGARMDSVPCGW